MKGIKKVLISALALLTIGMGVIGFSSCDKDKPDASGNDNSIVDNTTKQENILSYELLEDDTYMVTGVKEWYDKEKIVIPSEYEGKPVTSIDRFAFNACVDLMEIVIPGNVTNIGLYAFQSCKSLKKVYYTGEIEDWCGIIFKVAESNPLYYADNLYINNQLATELVIPHTVTEIKHYAFYGINCLRKITIPNSVTNIGEMAFDKCESLKDVYYTGEIEDWCGIIFETLWSNPLYYADNLYINNQLATELVIPNKVTKIKHYTFCGINCLKKITISDKVTSIGSFAFFECGSLNEIVIPNSVTDIGERAFEKCISLTEIAIPNSVMNIGAWAFDGCENLTKATIGNGLIEIHGGLFRNCGSLTEIAIPNSVTNIGAWAFEGCGNLTEIVIPDSVISIGSLAFDSCENLTKVTIGNGLKEIGSAAFNRCYRLKDVYYTREIEDWREITFNDDYANPLCYGAKLYINNQLVTG